MNPRIPITLQLQPLKLALALLSAFSLSDLSAAPRSGGPYSVPADSLDSGGGQVTSANYTVDHTLGDIGAVQTTATNVNKAGYAGTLTDPRSLQLNATPTNVNEGTSRQINAVVVNDDTSLTPVAPGSVAWTVASGPLTSINSTGLATAAIVFTNTSAVARGSFLGLSNTLGLLVLNVSSDDFGLYAGDGLDDAWQAGFFGTNSVLAGPGVDADGDGQTNAFEFVTGTVPTITTSRFDVAVFPVTGAPTQKDITFSPRFPDRTYLVDTTSNLLSWADITGTTTNDVTTTRTVRDLSATSPQKFYRVRVTKP